MQGAWSRPVVAVVLAVEFAGLAGGPGGESMVARVLESDADGDGKIGRTEAPERIRDRFDRIDTDGDGFITRAELEVRARRRGAPRE